MLSSTSSSSDRVPDVRWRCVWPVALAIALVLLGGWESFWRVRGFVPSIRATPAVWCMERERVTPDSVVLLGASRIQTGVNPAQLESLLGRRVVQLAIPGSSPLPLLEAFAAQQTFQGLLIVGLNPRVAFDATSEREADTRAYMRQYDDYLMPFGYVESHITTEIHAALVMRDPGLSPSNLADRIVTRRWPKPSHRRMDRRRFERLDFSQVRVDYVEDRQYQVIATHGRPIVGAGIAETIAHYATLVDQVRAHGGDVVFVRMPVSGRVKDVEEERYPRALYWDPFASGVGAVAIHYEDHDTLRHFTCPEGSHLSAADAARFTAALAALVK